MQYRVYVNGKPFDVVIESIGQTNTGTAAPAYTPQVPDHPAAAVPVSAAEERVLCPLPGSVLQISVTVGQSVSSGQCLAVLEAMKMENEIAAPRSGVVKQILVSKGAAVNTGDVLVVLS